MSEEGTECDGPLGYAFAVVDKAWCCWEYDHRARTLEFLDGLDCTYYSKTAEILGRKLEGDHALAASVTLRMLYVQAIETLFGMLGATVQAPEAAAAWIALSRSDDLQVLTKALVAGQPILTQAGPQRISLIGLSEFVHRYAWPGDAEDPTTATRFGRLWGRLASEFLDDVVRAEHNALKHGHRVRAGGFSVSIGSEEVPGAPAPAAAMRSLGGSKFGTTFFKTEKVGDSTHHVRARRTSVNWSAVAVANRLVLISMSIGNVVAALRCQLGVDPARVLFRRPIEPSAFDDVWTDSVGIRHMNMDSVIRIAPEDELSREGLLADLQSRTS